MTIGEAYGADLRNMISDAPVTFTFNGASYTGTYSGIDRRRPLEIGGFSDEPTITLAVALKDSLQVSVFSAAPAEGDQVTISGTAYRVVSTETDMFGEGLELSLETVSK